jgi:hypothetical protein
MWLIRSLTLLILIKNLGRHTAAGAEDGAAASIKDDELEEMQRSTLWEEGTRAAELGTRHHRGKEVEEPTVDLDRAVIGEKRRSLGGRHGGGRRAGSGHLDGRVSRGRSLRGGEEEAPQSSAGKKGMRSSSTVVAALA